MFWTQPINNREGSGQTQLLLSFRQGGKLLRGIFIVKCVCLSPKGELAFIIHLKSNKLAEVLVHL